MRRPQPYTWLAPLYDVVSAEWVYRVGREAGVAGLRLRPGHRVLDVGCGTGLNLPLLRAAVGPGGQVVGVDVSEQMLAQAARKVHRRRWTNIDLVRADATTVDAARLTATLRAGARGPDDTEPGFDAVLFTYSLSLMSHWRAAWRASLATAVPRARVAVVDLAEPTGAAAPYAPLARLACALGGSDIRAHPWTAVEGLVDVQSWVLRGGHLQVRAGSLR